MKLRVTTVGDTSDGASPVDGAKSATQTDLGIVGRACKEKENTNRRLVPGPEGTPGE